MEDGRILTTPGFGWFLKSAAGTKHCNFDLKNPISLIATLSHELAHQILLGENRIEENDEYLTDLTAIAYGFGIFIGNSRFEFSASGFGWESSGQGYLPEQVTAYAMAWLSNERNERTDFTDFLDRFLQKYFKQSMDWLAQNKGES